MTKNAKMVIFCIFWYGVHCKHRDAEVRHHYEGLFCFSLGLEIINVKMTHGRNCARVQLDCEVGTRGRAISRITQHVHVNHFWTWVVWTFSLTGRHFWEVLSRSHSLTPSLSHAAFFFWHVEHGVMSNCPAIMCPTVGKFNLCTFRVAMVKSQLIELSLCGPVPPGFQGLCALCQYPFWMSDENTPTVCFHFLVLHARADASLIHKT